MPESATTRTNMYSVWNNGSLRYLFYEFHDLSYVILTDKHWLRSYIDKYVRINIYKQAFLTCFLKVKSVQKNQALEIS